MMENLSRIDTMTAQSERNLDTTKHKRGTPVSAQEQQSATPAQTSTRGFWCLVGLQAQGAFNDNAYKLLLMNVAALIFSENKPLQGTMNGLISALIPLAFLIFSCWAGMLADKFSKWAITMTVKVVELGIMFLAFLVFWATARASGPTMATLVSGIVVGMMLFIHSAFFSPSKYGIIPELVPLERVSWANGIVAMTTNLAIITGMIFANELFDIFKPSATHNSHLHWIPLILMGLSLVGFALGWGVTRTTAANPSRRIELNYFPQLMSYFKMLFSNRSLGLTVLGLAYFWGVGVFLTSHLNVWGEASLGLTKVAAIRLYMLLALGIGAGSMLAGYISRHKIETGLIPLGGLGIALFCLPLVFATPHNRVIMIAMVFMVGVSAGVYSVPLISIMQSRTERADRGGLLGAATYITDSTMLLSAVFYSFLSGVIKLSPNMEFLVVSVVTLTGVVVLMRLLPEEFMRLVSFLLTKLVYRIRVTGLENIPAEGPVLLVSNHVSFVDALLLQAAVGRKLRFVVWEGLFRKPVLRRFLRVTQCIPISAEQSPRELITSLKNAGEVLKEGNALCIFAEGEITRTGNLNQFHPGYSVILKKAPAPIVPVFLDGVWGSIFSFERGKFFWKWPRRIPYPVRITVGKPLPPDVAPPVLRQAIEELGAESAIAEAQTLPLLHQTLVRQCRRHWGRFLMTDILSPPIKMGVALWRSVILARRLAPLWEGQQTVGVLLPPSVGGALVNYAAALCGKTVVNLNYTTGQAVLESCARRAELKTVVTARQFLEKVGLECPATPIFIEDYRGFHGFGEVFLAILAARFLTANALARFCGCKTLPTHDSLATIIFSSGSTGDPKGVMLTQANIAANSDSFRKGVRIVPADRMLGILPFFHSFGYTVSLWGSINFPVGMVYHFSPLDVKTIGELCEKHRVSIIVTTPTFLQYYMRRIPPAQLGSVNTVITGAEKLPEAMRLAFRERFGVDPLQGYGTTELSPVVSTNVDDFRQAGIHQVAHKPGSIGRPLPGIAARIIHTETGEPQPTGQTGLLEIRGGNVMRGYLGLPEKTAEVLRDGWYNTGDVAYIDEDGFIFITDRLSRFSKIGGEMVPHITIEEKIMEALGLSEPKLVVSAVPDEKKGEQLVVLHTLEEKELAGITEKLAEAGLPNLWIPKRENFFKIGAIPILGTGKLDLQGVKKAAADSVAARGAAAVGTMTAGTTAAKES